MRDSIVRQLIGSQIEIMILKSNNKGPLEIVKLLSGNSSGIPDRSGNLTIVENCLHRV
jgi:hypothetical protein